MPDATSVSGDRIRIGRDPRNNVVLVDLQISRFHAEVRRAGDTYQVIDMGSRNGTYLNGRRVQKATIVHAGDIIAIGHHELLWDGQRLHQHVDTGPASLIADDLTVRIGEKVLLDDVSFALAEGSLCAVIGPSGCGKSTLVKALTGLRPATQGRIWYGGQDLYADYSQLRYRLGLVPQDDVLHRQLKVRAALRYAAALRFADDVPRRVRWAKVNEVMATMRLTERAKQRIDTLSGGQRKRASVAMELLTEPSLFCLDEPTSGLDPALDKEIMIELRELADKGKTVIIVTHSVLHLDYCQRVLVMCLGGTMGYFGPPDQLLGFFDAKDYADVFTKITDEPERWTRAFRNSPLYARYVSAATPALVSFPETPAGEPDNGASDSATAANVLAPKKVTASAAVPAPNPGQPAPSANPPAPAPLLPAQRSGQLDDEPTAQLHDTGPRPDIPQAPAPHVTGERNRPQVAAAKPGRANMDQTGWRLFARNPTAHIRQYITLCTRMLNVILSDRAFSLFLVGMPLVLAALAYTVPGDNGLKSGTAAQGIQAMQLLVVLVTGASFLGTAVSIREIVNESPIYRRERAVGLSPAAYLASKFTIFFLINTAQTALFVYLALFEGPPSRSLVLPSQTVEIIVAMMGVTLGSTVLGLLFSALARTTEQTTPIMVVIVMAQLVFSGGLFLLAGSPVMETIAWLFPTRWGFAAGAETTGLFDMVQRFYADPLFKHDAGLWWWSITFMVLQIITLMALTTLVMRRHEPGRS